jgi:hypothetical protein
MAMSIIEIATKHGDILERLLAKSSGGLGEILVADALTKRGYSVRPTNNNARQSDLFVMSPLGVTFSVEVKTGKDRRPTWWVKKCPDPSVSAIWCFVSAPREATELPDPANVEIFVLTSEEARSIWKASDWNKRHPDNGDIRRWQIPDEALHAWQKLPS